MKTTKVLCPFCGKKHEINPAKMMAEMRMSEMTPERRKEIATKASHSRKSYLTKKR